MFNKACLKKKSGTLFKIMNLLRKIRIKTKILIKPSEIKDKYNRIYCPARIKLNINNPLNQINNRVTQIKVRKFKDLFSKISNPMLFQIKLRRILKNLI